MHKVITINSNTKARLQSLDLESKVLTFQLLDSDENPTGQAGQHIVLSDEVMDLIQLPVAAAIEDILPEEAEAE